MTFICQYIIDIDYISVSAKVRHFFLLWGFGPSILGLIPILANAPTDFDRRFSFFSRANPFSSVSFSLRDLRMEFRFGELSLLDPFLFSVKQ